MLSLKRNFQSMVRFLTGNAPLFVYRERVTIADVNTGATLLPAVPGYKYRLSWMQLIAIGGNAGAATDVRVLGTVSAAAVNLLITALAGLTRSTINAPGIANNTILADGASFTELDVNTAVTIGKTGAALTTATHIDVELQYELIPTRSGA